MGSCWVIMRSHAGLMDMTPHDPILILSWMGSCWVIIILGFVVGHIVVLTTLALIIGLIAGLLIGLNRAYSRAFNSASWHVASSHHPHSSVNYVGEPAFPRRTTSQGVRRVQ